MIEFIQQCDESSSNTCQNILVVDDSKVVRSIVKKAIVRCPDIDANLVLAESFEETQEVIEKYNFRVAVLDVHLPDAQNGEVIDLLLEKNVPVVVLTGTINASVKDLILEKDIIEYITKSNPQSISYIVSVVQRVLKNYEATVLLVDDSKSSRMMTRKSLEKLHVKILEASNAEEAINLLEERGEEVSLLLTDYEMPGINGMELTLKLRQDYSKDRLSIIAISGSENSSIATEFLRYGANDFIKKPFTNEELSTRINVNLELIELFKQGKENANKDFLTGMYNRRFFFESGTSIVEKAKRKKTPVAVAMIDIDLFKQINDTYGHDIGDIAIQEISTVLSGLIRTSDLLARFGGEEFCILMEGLSVKEIKEKFETIRAAFEKNVITKESVSFSYTVSIGIFYGFHDSLEGMIKLSDDALYAAKESGRNKVVVRIHQ